jgi:hypothetical protein
MSKFVVQVMEGTPAAQYVRPEDRLVKCGDFDVTTWDLGQVRAIRASKQFKMLRFTFTHHASCRLRNF